MPRTETVLLDMSSPKPPLTILLRTAVNDEPRAVIVGLAAPDLLTQPK